MSIFSLDGKIGIFFLRVLRRLGLLNRTYDFGNSLVHTFRIEPKRLPAEEENLYRDMKGFLENKFPDLKSFVFSQDNKDLKQVVEIYQKLLPLWNNEAREVFVRNVLVEALQKHPSHSFRKALEVEVAKSNLRQGIADHAKILLDHENPELRLLASKKISELESAYGAKYLTEVTWSFERGETLKYYYKAHGDWLRGKRILHFAPEPELVSFFKSKEVEWNLVYRTSDAFLKGVDYAVDICHAAELITERFDVIIIHRVLEHILDDRTAVKNLRGLLRPGGIIHHSVPMSCSEKTRNWDVPDLSHDGHLRQYGADYSNLFEEIGLKTHVDQWLLSRARDEYISNHAYPLRMYISEAPH